MGDIYLGNTHDIAEQVRARARKTVCAFAADVSEATELMCMLGIYPGQDDDDEWLASTPLNRVNS